MLPALPLPFAALTLLAGCAAPQYQTTVRLISPSTEAGRACVQACEAKKTACQAGCQRHYQACIKALEPQVEPRYLDALKEYELELKRYAAALRHYEIQLQFEWLHSYPFGHPYWWDPWPGLYFPPPSRQPQMPTRAAVRIKLEETNCQADCGCLPAYDTCFISCGGQRVSETMCIKNCPPNR